MHACTRTPTCCHRGRLLLLQLQVRGLEGIQLLGGGRHGQGGGSHGQLLREGDGLVGVPGCGRLLLPTRLPHLCGLGGLIMGEEVGRVDYEGRGPRTVWEGALRG